MIALGKHPLVGQWRIVEADLWDRSYLDLCGPATITTGADNRGEIAFGAMQATLDLSYSPSMAFFSWAGFDEMDEVAGEGSAELFDDGSIEITFAYHNGDEVILKAKRITSSTACYGHAVGWRERASRRAQPLQLVDDLLRPGLAVKPAQQRMHRQAYVQPVDLLGSRHSSPRAERLRLKEYLDECNNMI
jgi:hypothetical protein